VSPLSRQVSAAAALLLLAHPVSAEEISAAEANPLVITVTPTRRAMPIDQVGSTVTVVTAQDIARAQQRTVTDVLRAIPGLVLTQTGGPGGSATLSLRGTNSNHTKVLVDGIDIGDPSTANGAVDFGKLTTADIERIEVLRGPQSSLYGSDAIGGVVSITTRRGTGPARLTGSLEGGSFGTFNQSAGLDGAAGKIDYAFTLNHLRSNDTPVTPHHLLPPGRSAIGDASEITTASARLGLAVSETFSLGLVARYTDADLAFTGDDYSTFPATPAPAQSRSTDTQFLTRGEGRLLSFDGALEQKFGIALTEQNRAIIGYDPILSPPTAYRGERVKADWQGTLALGFGQTLTAGLEHQTDTLRDNGTDAENANRAGYAQIDSAFGGRLFNAISLRLDDNDRFGQVTTWRVAPSVLVTETDTRLKASYGTGFKAPSLSQLFVSYPAFNFFANPNLKPERSTGYDAGFEQDLVGGRLRFGATWFDNDITDLITTNAAFTSLENRPSATTRGVESFATLAVTPDLRLRADHTYTLTRDTQTGSDLLRRPKHKASLGLAWDTNDRVSLAANLLYVGARVDGNRDFSIQRLRAPAYTVVNLAGSYEIDERVTAFARIDNLLDRRAEDPTGFERPPLGLFLGLRMAIGIETAGR